MKIKRYFSKLAGFELNYYRTIHGIKTAIACTLGFAIATYYQWPSGKWVPITIMVVMSAQTHFGGTVRKSLMRFLGTIGGVAAAVLVLWVFGSNEAVVFATIFVLSVIFTYIASSHGDISYAGTIGGVTIILVLTSRHIGIDTAILRGFYITVGIIIALLVSRFIFPIHARDRLRYHVALTLRNLAKLYFTTTDLPDDQQVKKDWFNTKLNSKVLADIANQPRLIHEAVIGSREFAVKKDIFKAIVSSEESLSRLINLMYLSLYESDSRVVIEEHSAVVSSLHNTIGDALCNLADSFEFTDAVYQASDLDGALSKITKIVVAMSQNKDLHQQVIEHSFLFFMEQILKEFSNLEQLIEKVNGKEMDNVV